MMKRTKYAALLALVGGLALPASAQAGSIWLKRDASTGLYLSAGAGTSFANRDSAELDQKMGQRGHNINSRVDDSDLAYSLRLGWQFNDLWGLELGYTEFGDFDTNIQFNGSSNAGNFGRDLADLHPYGPQAISLSSTLSARIHGGLGVTFKLGVAYWESELNIAGNGFSVAFDRDSVDAIFGADIHYDLSAHGLPVRIGVEYTQLSLDNAQKARSVLATLRYSFKRSRR